MKMNANLLSTAAGLLIMAASAAATANSSKRTITNPFKEDETIYKVPGEGLCIDVSVGYRRINIYPHITKDGDKVNEFIQLQQSEKISFEPEAYRRAWRKITETDRYKNDDSYARRIRIAFNYAIKKFESKYGMILS